MSKHGEFLQAMLKYAEARGLQVARIGTAFRGKLPDYCIVDDDLQPVRELEAYLDSQPIRRTEPAQVQYIEPYDLNPTESTNMQSLKRTGLNPNYQPQTATEILKTAASTLGERGKQYDPAGKQERSMTAIVAAFNAIYPHNLLTVHMGWQFMSLVKMVRGATKPHADSALDQVAYAALAAECVAECLHQPVPTDAQAMAEALSKHEAQVEKLRERECLDIETINDLRTELASCKAMTAKFQAERKANVAMHEEVTRLRGKVQDLANVAEYRDKRNMELCAELSRAQDEIQSLLAEKRNLTARNKELEDKVQSLNNEVEAKVRELMSNLRHEAPCAHNTDEPKATRAEYVDPFDQYGDMRSPMHRLVGDRDPARGGLAYPAGKDAPTPQ